ncbi:MAG: hypothetical protein HQ525_04405 [Anaerolineae bacterium]|nr:hypothetical protein [Anaerolineae bacterium]
MDKINKVRTTHDSASRRFSAWQSLPPVMRRLLTCTATPAPQSGAALGARSAAHVSSGETLLARVPAAQ